MRGAPCGKAKTPVTSEVAQDVSATGSARANAADRGAMNLKRQKPTES
jgi:hypothetical protein